MDTDGDGMLCKKEILDGYALHFDHEITEEEVDNIFSAIDTDGNGVIDYSEFLMATMSDKDLMSKEKLKAAFRVFDKDGDGTITPDEIRTTLGAGGVMDKETVEKIIFEVDENGDGEISFEEFENMMKKAIGFS